MVAYFYGFSFTFPFIMTEGTYVPEHRLQALRLSTFTTFVYFGFRYLLFGSEKLHPIQFLGVSLFNLGVLGGLCLYFNDINDSSEYFLVPFFILSSIILYNAAKPKFRNYFKK
ncbi:hypothetical protein OAQ39_03045 [Alphaproteobacteria bacterium]|nr:hypothetical protein [Alphaproteobacteria bacterium]